MLRRSTNPLTPADVTLPDPAYPVARDGSTICVNTTGRPKVRRTSRAAAGALEACFVRGSREVRGTIFSSCAAASDRRLCAWRRAIEPGPSCCTRKGVADRGNSRVEGGPGSTRPPRHSRRHALGYCHLHGEGRGVKRAGGASVLHGNLSQGLWGPSSLATKATVTAPFRCK